MQTEMGNGKESLTKKRRVCDDKSNGLVDAMSFSKRDQISENSLKSKKRRLDHNTMDSISFVVQGNSCTEHKDSYIDSSKWVRRSIRKRCSVNDDLDAILHEEVQMTSINDSACEKSSQTRKKQNKVFSNSEDETLEVVTDRESKRKTQMRKKKQFRHSFPPRSKKFRNPTSKKQQKGKLRGKSDTDSDSQMDDENSQSVHSTAISHTFLCFSLQSFTTIKTSSFSNHKFMLDDSSDTSSISHVRSHVGLGGLNTLASVSLRFSSTLGNHCRDPWNNKDKTKVTYYCSMLEVQRVVNVSELISNIHMVTGRTFVVTYSSACPQTQCILDVCLI